MMIYSQTTQDLAVENYRIMFAFIHCHTVSSTMGRVIEFRVRLMMFPITGNREVKEENWYIRDVCKKCFPNHNQIFSKWTREENKYSYNREGIHTWEPVY